MDESSSLINNKSNYRKHRGHNRVNSIYTFEVKDNEIISNIVEPAYIRESKTDTKKDNLKSESESCDSDSSELNDHFDFNNHLPYAGADKKNMSPENDSGKKIIVEP